MRITAYHLVEIEYSPAEKREAVKKSKEFVHDGATPVGHKTVEDAFCYARNVFENGLPTNKKYIKLRSEF